MSRPQLALSGLMKMTGLRQIDVARHLGVTRSRLAGWLSGYSPIPDDAVLQIHALVLRRLCPGDSGLSGQATHQTDHQDNHS